MVAAVAYEMVRSANVDVMSVHVSVKQMAGFVMVILKVFGKPVSGLMMVQEPVTILTYHIMEKTF